MTRHLTPRSAARALGAVAAAVVLGGCATKSDIRQLQTEVREELRAQAARQDSLLVFFRRETLSTQDTLRTQSDQLFDFRGDITRLLQSIAQGQARLEALVGENQRGIAQLRAQGVGSQGPAGGPGLSIDGAQTPAGGAETVAGVGGGNAEQLYQIAREQHTRGSMSAAQRAYEQFLEDHPNDPRAPDARYFLADLLLQQNRPEDALGMFLEIPARHPAADRVPDALFRIARLQADLGDTEDARATLERLMNTYPESGLATLARDMLEELS